MTGKHLREVAGGQRVAHLDDCVCLIENDASHTVECDVRRELLSHSDLRFSSLVVRRIDNGVCLEGVVETDGDLSAVDRLATTIKGVNCVLNRLVVRRPDETPAPKG